MRSPLVLYQTLSIISIIAITPLLVARRRVSIGATYLLCVWVSCASLRPTNPLWLRRDRVMRGIHTHTNTQQASTCGVLMHSKRIREF